MQTIQNIKITDMITITELSRLLGKSRPTVYKYISDFEEGNLAALPHSVKKLFLEIQSGNIHKKGVYEYCEHWFAKEASAPTPAKKNKPVTLKEIFALLKKNERKLNLENLKKYIGMKFLKMLFLM